MLRAGDADAGDMKSSSSVIHPVEGETETWGGGSMGLTWVTEQGWGRDETRTESAVPTLCVVDHSPAGGI